MNGKKLHNGHLRPRRGHMLQKMSDFAQDWNQRQEEVHVDFEMLTSAAIPFYLLTVSENCRLAAVSMAFFSMLGKHFSNDLVFDYGAPTA